jgi:hypothetical protein
MKNNNKGMLIAFSSAIAISAMFLSGCQKDDLQNESSSEQITVEDSSSISAEARRRGLVIKTGPDQTITLPKTSVTVDGSGSEGNIRYFRWSKDWGSSGARIKSPNSARTDITGLKQGVYRFRLKITDRYGRSLQDTIRITVKGTGDDTPPPSGNNQAPVVNAGSNQTITQPASSVTLNGSASDADGSIASYRWTKVSGSGGTIASPNSRTTSVTNLTPGTYVFNLKATDNDGAAGNKSVTVTVKPSGTTTPPPGGGGNYGTLMYSTGYNSQSDIVNGSNQLGQGSISTSKYKVGPGSFRSMVNSNPASNISSGWRSEVQYSSSYSRDGDEIVVEYDLMYEKLFNTNGLTTQWHGNASGTSGQLALWIQNGKFMVMRSVKSGVNIYQSGTLKTIETNKWYKMRWEVKFSPGNDGYVRLYIDNVLYYSTTGKTSDGTGQYLKIGTNRWNVSSESVVYYDDLKIWKR